MTTLNQAPERVSRMLSLRTSSFTPLNLVYSRSSEVKSFTRREPDTERVSFTIWFISSFFAWVSCRSFRRTLPALREGMIKSGITSTPTMANCQLRVNRATRLVTTVAMALTAFDRVPEMTLETPEMSVFMRVMMSPCFSVVKKEWGMYCRWLYIWFFISKTMREEIQALM